MTNLIRFDCMKWSFEMIVYWNVEMTICWSGEMIICWDVENVLWCWLTVSISETFRWGCICCVRYENDLDWNANDWCIFLKKFDQMNVYEGRSTVPDDVRKWSNECDAAIELWGRQAVDLMSEVLHLMPMLSDALAIECDVRHAALNLKAIRWEAVDAQIAAFDRDEVRCIGDCLIVKLLHSIVKWSNARWRLSVNAN